MRPLFQTLRSLYPLLGLPRWSLPVLVFLGILTALSEGLSISLIIPLLQSQGNANPGFSNVLGSFFNQVPADIRLQVIGGAILAGIIFKNLLSYGYSLFFQWLNSTANHRLRTGILRQVLSVSQSYLDQQDNGKLFHILNSETWRTSSAFSVLAGLLINICMVLIFCVLFFLLSWKLTLITGVALLIISAIIRSLTWRARRCGDLAAAANTEMTQRANEIFAGLRLIRSFGREPHEQKRYNASSEEVRRTFFRIDVMSGMVGPTSEILTALLLLALLLTAIKNPSAMGPTLTFLLLLYRLYPRVKQIDLDRVTLNSLASSVEQVRALMDPTDKSYLATGEKRLLRLETGITFQNVSLQYQSAENPALVDINFTLKAGQTTALVGPSGAGKSSMISLVCRFYDPSAGQILLDGNPLTEIDLAWWHEKVAVVSQDIHLFNASALDNIAYGKLDATREEIFAAARQAGALEFIEALPNKFDTILGERGIRLSGGQRQRLALARAFVREPELLILDEATNSLDLISEQLVQDALLAFGGKRTVLIVAHRISTIEHADQILVLDDGRLVQQGTLASLLAEGGLFGRLYALQFRQKRDPALAHVVSV